MTTNYDLKGKYENGQTPQERLNNLLTPFFTLSDIVNISENSLTDSEKNKRLQDFIKHCAITCAENKEQVRNYLHDIPIFYKKENNR
jgi:hypothetical protein